VFDRQSLRSGCDGDHVDDEDDDDNDDEEEELVQLQRARPKGTRNINI
jgi:hypothetical protein